MKVKTQQKLVKEEENGAVPKSKTRNKTKPKKKVPEEEFPSRDPATLILQNR